jgi:gliding motility-associated-like protein
MSEQKENIEKIFREALQSHEVPVGPEVWASIQSSLAGLSTATSTAVGSLFLGKAAAVIGFAGLITAATIAEVNYHQAESNAAQEIVVEGENSKTNEAEQTVLFEEENTSEEQTSSTIEPTPSTQGDDYKQENESITSVVAPKAQLDKQTHSTETETSISSIEATTAQAVQVAETTNRNKAEDSNPTKGESTPEIAASSTDKVSSLNEEKEEVMQEKTTAYFTHSAEQVITPNGDPYNEYFEVEGFGVKDFVLRIMTRGGQLVFESNDISVRWNGVDRFGNALPGGIYFYEIQAVGDDNLPYLEKNAKGSITIMRN